MEKKPGSIVHREYLELSFLICGKNHTEKKFLSEKQSFYLTFTEKYPHEGNTSKHRSQVIYKLAMS